MQNSLQSSSIKHPADWNEVQHLSGLLYGSNLEFLPHSASTNSKHMSPLPIQLIMYCLTKYMAISISSPIENSFLLKQVQFVPSDDYVLCIQTMNSARHARDLGNQDPVQDSYANNYTNEELSADDGSSSTDRSDSQEPDDDASFFDPEEYASRIQENIMESTSCHSIHKISHRPAPTAADTSGYLLRTTFSDDDPTRPPYQLPTLNSGTFGTIVSIISLNDEGFASLWKGNSAHFLRDLMFSWVQPTVSDILSSVLSIPMDDTPLSYSENPTAAAGLLVASHAISGILFSPLELVQTRRVVQTSKRHLRKYKSIWGTIATIIREEYPNRPLDIFFSSNLLVPSLAFHILSPVFKYLGPLVIERGVGVDEDGNPLVHMLCQISFVLVELAVMLPIETIRKRLMCQVVRRTSIRQPGIRKSGGHEEQELHTLVQTSPFPYTDSLNCLYRIIKEEGGVRNGRGKNSESTWGHRRHDGASRSSKPNHRRTTPNRLLWRFSALYRGFSARFMASVSLIFLQAIVKLLEIDSD
ncbi:hypothetical protein BASA83_003138 [Batrachochytrium salamandrivorans]|nr:hypothetical protein BASA81_006069 [Batrachochytrium salamandrivorans]KAH9274505.1 hypothetical protein BASA83_003138 [Batrachochytrium salamandrivorans]